MRAKEFIKEFTVNVPVTINIPLGDVGKSQSNNSVPKSKDITDVINVQGSPDVINPGVRYGKDGDAKWSPPLQQHLDTVKDSVGPTTENPTEINPTDTFHTPQQSNKTNRLVKNNSMPTMSIKPSILG